MTRALRDLLGLLPLSRRQLLIGLTVAVVQSLVLLPVALIVRDVFDNQIPNAREGVIALSGAGVLALYGVSLIASVASQSMVVRETKRSVARLRRDLLVQIHRLPRGWHDRQDGSALHASLIHDTDRIDTMLAEVANPVLPALAVSVGLAVLALVLNPLLFAVLCAVVPLMVVVGQVVGRRTRRRAEAWSADVRAFAAGVQASLRTLTLARVQGTEAREVERRVDEIDSLAESGRRLAVAQAAHTAVQGAIGAATGAVVLVVGGIAVVRGAMTLGDMLAFYAIAALLVRQLALVAPGLDQLLTAADAIRRLRALLEVTDREPYAGDRRIDFGGDLRLEDVSFGYRSGELVLRGVDLRLAPGERLAVVGPNGVGKSTLVSLVLGLYAPAAGRLLADGVPYAELDLRAMRRRMGVVLQDPVLLSGTVRENVAYGNPDAGDGAVLRALTASTADVVVAALPEGLDTEVGDGGLRLSGGARRRLAIARALLGEPSLLVLDEPTTYLDETAIGVLLGNLASLPTAPAVLLVTHDTAVATRADRIAALRDGVLVEVASLDWPAARAHPR